MRRSLILIALMGQPNRVHSTRPHSSLDDITTHHPHGNGSVVTNTKLPREGEEESGEKRFYLHTTILAISKAGNGNAQEGT
ncbi:hypothetical protein Y1Q_0010304 [Alligator mississippiensis]|uniref:Uncharacterized protein n=1 Tax=Alligator mississippiensis TaxID=8496 RepID=A0A151NMG6_ALLMI|nr:hypothetical protein Y1Q_0010304 [Alligator mississippiensis]